VCRNNIEVMGQLGGTDLWLTVPKFQTPWFEVSPTVGIACVVATTVEAAFPEVGIALDVGATVEVGATVVDGATVEAGAPDEGVELVRIICASFWEFGGLVTTPDVLVAFVAPMPWFGRVISGSCFLFLKRIHNTNQQFYTDKFRKKNYKQSTKGLTGRANLFTLNFGKQSLV